MVSTRPSTLSTRTGIGLVIANMVGAGVFLSTGFMAQDLNSAEILVSWVVGAGLALLGCTAYAALASAVGRSGGEYRYLSQTLHPSLGYFSGWASLLVGFSATVAIDARAVGAFGRTVGLDIDPRVVGTLLIVGLTLAHARRHDTSQRTQDALVAVKIALVLGFVAVGLALGSAAWPTWTPPHRGASTNWGAMVSNQYWIAFAFSGWNAAIYAAEEFADPKRDVPHAMWIGCGAVGLAYLVINWVFVANLDPAAGAAVFDHETTRITLAHVVMSDLVGPTGGAVTSVAMMVVFTSAMSAMTLVGPRVYAEMARDGFLPRFLEGGGDGPPGAAVVLQGSIALVLLYSHTLLETVQSVSAVLMLFSGLTAVSVLRLPGAGIGARAAGLLYGASMAVLLSVGVTASPRLAVTLLVALLAGSAGYAMSRRPRSEGGR